MAEDYVCVIGSLNYDMIMKQQRMPKLGETYTADSISYAGGGKGANQAVQCAKLGLKTMMAGKLGRDTFGRIIRENLKSYGVDCSQVRDSEYPTGIGVIHALDNGEVYASIITGANYDMSVDEVESMNKLIGQSRILILQMEIPVPVVEALIRKAHGMGVYVILNAAPAKEIDRETLRLVDCLIVNETEASFYAETEISDFASVGEHLAELTGLTDGTIIVTLGSKGSVLLQKGEAVSIPPVRVEHAIETTGAGDSYIGAFAYGKFHGMENEAACRFAASVSAVTVTKIGAQEAMPYLSELKKC